MARKEDLVIQIIDDCKADRFLLKSCLDKKIGKGCYSLIEAGDASKGLDEFKLNKPDCVLLDYNLPDDNGLNVLSQIKEMDEFVPVIIITSLGDETLAAKAMFQGASYYLPKKDLDPNQLFKVIFEAFSRSKTNSNSKLNSNNTLSILAHEIKTPLNTIVMVSNLLEDAEETVEQKQYLQVLNDSAQYLLQLSESVMNFNRIQNEKFSMNLSPGNLEHYIKNMISYLSYSLPSEKINLDFSIKGDFPAFVMADFLLLKQALINLINNAYKFTHRGYIHVSVNLLERTNATIKVRFSVVDTGIGIPEDMLAEIFDMYKQACPSIVRDQGIGLGLAITKSLVEAMGGEVKVESKIGEGSKFSFDLSFVVLNGYTPEGNVN